MDGSEKRLLYFRADGCAVCVMKRPVVEGISRTTGIPLEVIDLETPAGRERGEALRIKTVPTLALTIGVRVPFRLVGALITEANVTRMLGATAPPPLG